MPKGELTLSESHFIGVSDAALVEASTKPFGVGLFTATGVLGTYGMWRTYLDLNPWGTRPWHTWAVEPHDNAVVQEIASASQWVDFVLSHPRRERGWLFPDWNSVAHQCDGVHMTLRAIAAALPAADASVIRGRGGPPLPRLSWDDGDIHGRLRFRSRLRSRPDRALTGRFSPRSPDLRPRKPTTERRASAFDGPLTGSCE